MEGRRESERGNEKNGEVGREGGRKVMRDGREERRGGR